MALPEALSAAVSKERPSGEQWLGATAACRLLLLFAWRGRITVPDLCLTVRMPPLLVCSNSLTTVSVTQGQKTSTSPLLPSPLLPPDIGNLAILWTLLPSFWASPHPEQLMQAAMVLHAYAPCLLACVPHRLSLNYHYT